MQTQWGKDCRLFGFSGFRLDILRRELHGLDGKPIRLTSRALEILVYLIEQRDRTVGQDELLTAVWPGRVVEENNLSQAVAASRTGSYSHDTAAPGSLRPSPFQ